jgi:hypothetical protein
MVKMPTFLIIGAARSGTTALYQYMKQHPEIFMSERKESNFFAYENEILDCLGPGADYINNSINNLRDYKGLFEGVSGERAVGEASPLYLYSEKAPGRIHHHIPEVKLIAILRNPIEQAFSHFLYAKRQMLEPLEDFSAALEVQVERKEKCWQPMFQYSRFPTYYQQLKRFYNYFPEHQIKIYIYEEFENDPRAVLSDIYSFVGVDRNFLSSLDHRPNVGGVPKNRFLQDIVMRPHLLTALAGRLVREKTKRRIRDAVSDRNLQTPAFPEVAKNYLKKELREEILNLQTLLNRDLSDWLQ